VSPNNLSMFAATTTPPSCACPDCCANNSITAYNNSFYSTASNMDNSYNVSITDYDYTSLMQPPTPYQSPSANIPSIYVEHPDGCCSSACYGSGISPSKSSNNCV
jgi:hypothetical protein